MISIENFIIIKINRYIINSIIINIYLNVHLLKYCTNNYCKWYIPYKIMSFIHKLPYIVESYFYYFN